MHTFARAARIVAGVCGVALVAAACTSHPSGAATLSSTPPAGSSVAASSSTPAASSAGGGSPAAVSQGSVATLTAPSPSTRSTAAGTATPAAGSGAQQLQQAFVSVSARVLPSVVEISTNSAIGSGIIFDTAGHIVTNHHVVGTSKDFTVRLSDGRTFRATLTGGYPAGDLAVIRIAGATNLHPASFGDSSKLKIGNIVLAVGNPLGLEGSVTEGIVSAVGRTMTEPPEGGLQGATLPNTIQTSAPINPGNSGGALVNLDGQVVGIPTLAATSAQDGGAAPGIGFAIPSNVASDIAQQIIKYGTVRNTHRAALGITATTVYDQQTGTPAGVGIVTVVKGDGAAKAGLTEGEIIVSINGSQTPTTAALSEVLAQFKPGDQVSVTVRTTDGTQRSKKVTLSELPAG